MRISSIAACMSSVVVINCVIALSDNGYGEDKGIATLLCAATTIDEVMIVSIAYVCFSNVFGQGQSNMKNYLSFKKKKLLIFILSNF